MKRLGCLVAALAMTVAGCTPGSAPPESDEAPGETLAADTPPAPTSTAPDEETTTLNAFFGWNGDPATQLMDRRAEEERIQEAIRVCMAEQGFEYRPVIFSDQFAAVRELDERQHAARDGFMITTWVGNQQPSVEPEWTDPNEELLNGMAEAEQQAWWDALYGTEQEQADATVVFEGGTLHGRTGCYGEAYDDPPGDPALAFTLWQELTPDLEALYEAVRSDPRVVEAEDEWARCMAGEGYEVTTVQEFHAWVATEFHRRLVDIVGSDFIGADPLEGMTEEERGQIEIDQDQVDIEAFMLSWEEQRMEGVDRAALEALQQEERYLAVADFDCRGDYQEIYQDVLVEYEADFIDENLTLLEQIREAQGR